MRSTESELKEKIEEAWEDFSGELTCELPTEEIFKNGFLYGYDEGYSHGKDDYCI